MSVSEGERGMITYRFSCTDSTTDHDSLDRDSNSAFVIAIHSFFLNALICIFTAYVNEMILPQTYFFLLLTSECGSLLNSAVPL